MKEPKVMAYNFKREAMEAEAQLLPCPFCGNREIEFSMIHPQHFGEPDETYWCYWEILCPECGALMQNGKLDTQTWDDAKVEIITLWNTRSNDGCKP